jgi:hypothetical protein
LISNINLPSPFIEKRNNHHKPTSLRLKVHRRKFGSLSLEIVIGQEERGNEGY